MSRPGEVKPEPAGRTVSVVPALIRTANTTFLSSPVRFDTLMKHRHHPSMPTLTVSIGVRRNGTGEEQAFKVLNKRRSSARLSAGRR